MGANNMAMATSVCEELKMSADEIVMRWIAVADGKPTPDTHMVLVTRYGDTNIAFWRKGKFLEEPMGFEAAGVTHWMYLPVPACRE